MSADLTIRVNPVVSVTVSVSGMVVQTDDLRRVAQTLITLASAVDVSRGKLDRELLEGLPGVTVREEQPA